MNDYKFQDIAVGHCERFELTISDEMMEEFYLITHDDNPLHRDVSYAESKGFKGRVVYGMLTAALFSTLAGVYLPGRFSLIHSIEIKMVEPVYINDKLYIEGKVVEKNLQFHFIKLKISAKKHDGTKVARGVMQIGVIDDDASKEKGENTLDK